MSQEGFRDWLIAKDHNSVTPYVYAINRVSNHYSENSGIPVDLYGITELDTLKGIADKYRQNGIYSEFGFKNAGLHRAAVLKYLEFFLEIFGDVKDEPGGEGSGDGIAANILTYEKDLKSTLCSQVADL